jgi:hypothetical protein
LKRLGGRSEIEINIIKELIGLGFGERNVGAVRGNDRKKMRRKRLAKIKKK